MSRPPPIGGLRHVALKVRNFSACQHFYIELLGFAIEWQPDDDNIYLTSGADNLALHRTHDEESGGSLDHIGMILRTIEAVDIWYEFLLQHQVPMDTQPKTHRDGARSFYCRDPDGNCVQLIYHPPIAQAC